MKAVKVLRANLQLATGCSCHLELQLLLLLASLLLLSVLSNLHK